MKQMEIGQPTAERTLSFEWLPLFPFRPTYFAYRHACAYAKHTDRTERGALLRDAAAYTTRAPRMKRHLSPNR